MAKSKRVAAPTLLQQVRELAGPRWWQGSVATFVVLWAVAMVLWLFTALGKVYPYTMQLPVGYTDQGYISRPVGNLPRTLTIDATARGWALLQYLFVTPVDSLTLRLPEAPERASFLTLRASAQLREQLPRGFRIAQVTPEVFEYRSSPLMRKQLTVLTTGTVQCEPTFGVSRTIIRPEKIWVAGPKALMDSLEYLPTRGIDTTDVTASFQKRYLLSLPQGVTLVDSRQNPVRIAFRVERLTEYSRMVDVVGVSTVAGFAIRPVPAQVKVVFNVPLSLYESARKRLVTAEVVLPARTSAPRLPVRVTISGKPTAGLRTVPATVEYLLIKP